MTGYCAYFVGWKKGEVGWERQALVWVPLKETIKKPQWVKTRKPENIQSENIQITRILYEQMHTFNPTRWGPLTTIKWIYPQLYPIYNHG